MAQSPTPISAYIRALNAGPRLSEVIEAAFVVAREVVVVDSGSTDGTPERAEAAGARLLRQPWLGNGAQKRVGEAACRHDWLLDLDADEVVTPALAAEIRSRFAAGEPSESGFRLALDYISPLDGRTSLGRTRRMKLYDRRRAGVPDHPVWDAARPKPGERVGAFSAPIAHHAFRDLGELAARLARRAGRNARVARPRGLGALRLRILFGMPVYLAKGLLSRGMIRGGTYGFATAFVIAFGRWLRDVRMYEAARGLDLDAPPEARG